MIEHTRITECNHQLVELGKIGRPHGVRGEIRLFLHNPTSDFIYSLSSIHLGMSPGKEMTKYSVISIKGAAKFHILKLKGVNGREQAQLLCGQLLWIPRASFPPLDEGEYYINDLIGIEVTCNQVNIGRIVDSREQGGIEVVTVADSEREIQIPLIEQYVSQMNIPSKLLEVYNIQDLPVYSFSSGTI